VLSLYISFFKIGKIIDGSGFKAYLLKESHYDSQNVESHSENHHSDGLTVNAQFLSLEY